MGKAPRWVEVWGPMFVLLGTFASAFVWGFGLLREDMGLLREDMGRLREDMGQLREDIRENRQAIEAVRENVRANGEAIAELSGYVRGLRGMDLAEDAGR